MIVGYMRVKDNEQVKILKHSGATRIFQEKSSDAVTHHPKLQKMFTVIQQDDVVVVTSLSQLARNIMEAVDIVHSLHKRGVTVNILDIGLLDSDEKISLFLSTLLAVLQLERKAISDRRLLAQMYEGFNEQRSVIQELNAQRALILLRTYPLKHVGHLLNIDGEELKNLSILTKKRRKKLAA